jgi:hypothetical protein
MDRGLDYLPLLSLALSVRWCMRLQQSALVLTMWFQVLQSTLLPQAWFVTFPHFSIKVDHGRGHHNLQASKQFQLMACPFYQVVITLAGRVQIY